jgi:hypothetical protein
VVRKLVHDPLQFVVIRVGAATPPAAGNRRLTRGTFADLVIGENAVIGDHNDQNGL